MSRWRRKVGLAALMATVWWSSAQGELAAAELVYINEALRQWLVLMEIDQAYLVVDRQAGEVRLQHGKAILRQCPVVVDSMGTRPDLTGTLQQRIRRYRPRSPWAQIERGAFDWENNLAEQATADCALYFDGGLLIYASPLWEGALIPSLRLEVEDLRALYNVGQRGLTLVVLPLSWDEELGDEH